MSFQFSNDNFSEYHLPSGDVLVLQQSFDSGEWYLFRSSSANGENSLETIDGPFSSRGDGLLAVIGQISIMGLEGLFAKSGE